MSMVIGEQVSGFEVFEESGGVQLTFQQIGYIALDEVFHLEADSLTRVPFDRLGVGGALKVAQGFKGFHADRKSTGEIAPATRTKDSTLGDRKILVNRFNRPPAVGTFTQLGAVPQQVEQLQLIIADGNPGVRQIGYPGERVRQQGIDSGILGAIFVGETVEQLDNSAGGGGAEEVIPEGKKGIHGLHLSDDGHGTTPGELEADTGERFEVTRLAGANSTGTLGDDAQLGTFAGEKGEDAISLPPIDMTEDNRLHAVRMKFFSHRGNSKAQTRCSGVKA